MEIEYLLVGHGRDGQIKRDDFPKDRLSVYSVQVRRAGEGHMGDPVHTFVVHRVAHGGAIYAIGIARNISEHEIKMLIDESGVTPIPENLL
ncbi:MULTISPECIES: hypothetical protein [unclassified Pantoea]|uniref:hypothetical protein n=1 Tax=unclassified Pantoea TaxID=2630326 RepID=UPI0023DCB12A|nr:MULTISPECIES: hypothetical protein [unclassified Pantoea]MDF2040864.1 hypothetical protein [Pantoea sp. Cr_R14]MDF2071271.1 hypothetical protein [Pantoea sp. Cr_R13]MDF2080400.1 hypothetical protein [Pantoea sp. Cr_R21]